MDITNIDEVKKKTKNVDIIVHLAGNVRKNSQDTTEKHYKINFLGTLNILEAARINKIKKIIMASTVEVYGDQLPSGRVSESDLCTPFSYYGQSKLLAENCCLQYSKKFGIKCVILRFVYLYGKGMYQSRIISKMIDAARTNQDIIIGLRKSDYFDVLYAKDAARAVTLSVNAKTVNGNVLNISSNKKTTLKEIAKIIKKYYPNFKVTYKKKIGCQPSYYYNNKRAEKIINFKPKYNLKNGLQDLIKNNGL